MAMMFIAKALASPMSEHIPHFASAITLAVSPLAEAMIGIAQAM